MSRYEGHNSTLLSMPLTVTYNHCYSYLRVSIVGAWPSAIEQARVRAGLIEQGVLTQGTCVLIDLRGLTHSPTPDEIQSAIATAVAQETGSLRRALLVTRDQFDTTCAFTNLGDYEGAPIKLFKDESTAVRWLTARPADVTIDVASPRPSPTESL